MSRPLPDGPAPSPLTDRFGRVHTDLRVSLTDRCNLRCTYCMPAEGLDWLPRPELLTDDEVVRLVDVATRRLGITEVRLTGGEPLLRRGLPGLVARLHALPDAPELSLTTNGIGLARSAAALRDAGLSRVNVSLDTLRPERFTAITRRDRLADVLDGLRVARAAGLAPVKINTVPVRGVNGRRDRRTRRVRRRTRLPGTVHRVDAPGRAGRLGPGPDGHLRGDPRPHR
ncbi:cyclic pyranopterin phosphate synthase [Streptomyces sp. Termitarium-T10T-6]|nr:cyclic pyranopterin phosphate synthase [Streptomyces sp. Termitarium-T10T-6]